MVIEQLTFGLCEVLYVQPYILCDVNVNIVYKHYFLTYLLVFKYIVYHIV